MHKLCTNLEPKRNQTAIILIQETNLTNSKLAAELAVERSLGALRCEWRSISAMPAFVPLLRVLVSESNEGDEILLAGVVTVIKLRQDSWQ